MAKCKALTGSAVKGLILWSHTSLSYTFARFPGEVELEGAHNYLANIPLADYGPSVTVPDEDHDALSVATDDFCLSSLKVEYNVLSKCWYSVNLLVVMCTVPQKYVRLFIFK